jgi:hypothetical protein
MKVLYILVALMLIGAFVMFISSYQIFTKMQEVKLGYTDALEAKALLRPYVFASYLGLTGFIVGGLGALVMIITTFGRRF